MRSDNDCFPPRSVLSAEELASLAASPETQVVVLVDAALLRCHVCWPTAAAPSPAAHPRRGGRGEDVEGGSADEEEIFMEKKSKEEDEQKDGGAVAGADAAAFQGHYIVLRYVDLAGGTVWFSDPSARVACCQAPLAMFEQARHARGTDDDVLVLRAAAAPRLGP